jgi:hypothetical protein
MRSISLLLAIILLAMWAIFPFFVWFPASVGAPGESHDVTCAVVVVMVVIVIAMASVASQKQDGARIRLLRNLAVMAVIGTVASFLLGLDIRYPTLDVPTPHVLAPALGVDGESAYDADVFEIYCEIWLCVAAVTGAVAFVLRNLSKRWSNRPATR